MRVACLFLFTVCVSAFQPAFPRSLTRTSRASVHGLVCRHSSQHTSLHLFGKIFGGGKDEQPAAPRRAAICTCNGARAISCQTCGGSGIDKKGGNVFERWKCMECQGFGQVSCPGCGAGGLTPEQTGER